jgi:hypothetical protein
MISPRLVFIVAALGPRRLAIAWPKHLARGGRFVDRRRVRSCVQELGAALAWLDRGWFVKFSFLPGEGKI